MGGIGESMTGVPHVGVLAGADLVVDAEDVEVGLGAQVEDAQIPGGGQPHQMVDGMVGGDHQSRGPVPFPERTGESACRIARPERPGFGIEAVARRREAVPGPLRRCGGVDAPQFGAGVDASASQADGTDLGQWRPVAGGKVRHRRRRASAIRRRRSSGRAAPRRSTSRPVRRAAGA